MTSNTCRLSAFLRSVQLGMLAMACMQTVRAEEGSAGDPSFESPPSSRSTGQFAGERSSNGCLPGSDVHQMVDRLLRAYERGDVAELQRLIDPQTLSLGRILDGAVREQLEQIRVRVQRLDQTLQCGANVASVHFVWEKRSQSAVDLKPRLRKGRTALLLVNSTASGEPAWRVVSVAGLDLFVPARKPPPTSAAPAVSTVPPAPVRPVDRAPVVPPPPPVPAPLPPPG